MRRNTHYKFILAIFLGILSLSLAFSAKIFAKGQSENFEARSGETNDGEKEKVKCSYQVGDWSDCSSSGKRTRKVSKNGNDCIEDGEAPESEEKCDPPKTACSYTYTGWSECNSSGKQTRKVATKTPSDCEEKEEPKLEQSCTYSGNGKVSEVNAPAASVKCKYATGNWSACSASGKQTRTLSLEPAGCSKDNGAEIPATEQACKYSPDSSENTTGNTSNESREGKNFLPANSTAAKTSDSGITPSFQYANLGDGNILSGSFEIEGSVNGAAKIEFYLIPAESNIPKYLGSARNVSSDKWQYDFNTLDQPNGSYYLRPKIKNSFGTYDGDKKLVIILNPVTPVDSSDSSQTQNEKRGNEATKNSNGNTNSEWQKHYFNSETCVDPSICGGESDPDKDNLSNDDEFRYGTDPRNPDTDGDGFLDGDEVRNGFNPLQSSPGDKSDRMVFESPKDSGEVKSETYKVESVEMLESSQGNKIKLTGKALPNTFVTIYIFSEPIILTVKTDSSGNWEYELDKNLDNGQHEAYVAITDNTGKITSKSEPIAFVKTAEAVSVVTPSEAAQMAGAQNQSPTGKWYRQSLIISLALAFSGIALALAAVGLYQHNALKKTLQPKENKPE